MNSEDLTTAKTITLRRCPNGWTAHDGQFAMVEKPTMFAFESTESLSRQLVRLVGKSGWEVSTPKRDAKGHFLPNPKSS